MKFKKYRVKKEHIYSEKANTPAEIRKVYQQGYVFFQGIHGDYYMLSAKEYKTKPSMLESQMVELEIVD